MRASVFLRSFGAALAAWAPLTFIAMFSGAARAQDSGTLTGFDGVAVSDGALGTIFNPALVGLRYPSELFVSSTYDELGNHQRLDLLGSAGGFGLRYTHWPGAAQTAGVTLAGGDPRLRLGWSAEWSGPDLHGPAIDDHRLGLLSRPVPWVSLGATVDHLFQPSYGGRVLERDYTVGAAFRPLALPRPSRPGASAGARPFPDASRLTITADAFLPVHPRDRGGPHDSGTHPSWRYGFDLEPLQGLAFRYTYETGTRLGSFGVVLRLPRLSLLGRLTGVRADGTTDAFLGSAGASPYLPSPSSFRSAAESVPNTWPAYSLSLHSGEEPTGLVPPPSRRVGTMRIGGLLGDDDLAGFSLLSGSESNSSVKALHDRLDLALRDAKTRGVLLELDGVGNRAALEELRPRIARLRESGKPVVAYLPNGGGRGDLWLASACDAVVASEEAMFWQLGLRTERRYYRGLLERLGIRIDRSSIGQYKSAYRTWSADSTPPADREVIDHVLDQVQEEFVTTVSGARHMDRARLETLLDGRSWPTEELVKAGLVDSVGYRETAVAMLGRLAKLGPRPRTVRLADVETADRRWNVSRGIAVVYASGGIELGESGNDLWNGPSLGSSTLIRQIEAAFRAPEVKAVVLRVESPGGSTLASDLIYHALERMKRETHKPLAVSMGGIAASGGYFIALPADRIFTDRMTYTGSIGVVFIHPSLEGMDEKLGVHQDAFQRGASMGGGSFHRDWTAADQASADSAIARTYDRFVDKVAASRHLPREEVLASAQGRVWLGDDALSRGLVDEIGGLDAAIAWARRAGGLESVADLEPLEFRRPRPGLLQRLAGSWLREEIARQARFSLEPAVRFEAGDDLGF